MAKKVYPSTKASRSAKRPKSAAKNKRSVKKLPGRNRRKFTLNFVALLIFATIASAFTLFSFAQTEYPSGKDEVVVEFRKEKPINITRDSGQNIIAWQQGAFTRVLGDGTIECVTEDSSAVLTGKLASGQLKQLFKDTDTSGLRDLPDEQFLGDDTSNFVGSLESVWLNSTEHPKTAILYDGVARSAVFDRVSKIINKQCSSATEKKSRQDLRTIKSDLVNGKRNSTFDRLLGTQTAYALNAGVEQSSENDQLNRINTHRSTHAGKASLANSGCMNDIARLQATRMATQGYISHNANLANEVSYACGGDANGYWLKLGENVGVGNDSAGLMTAFLGSSAHHANIDDSAWNFMAVGAYRSSNGRLWVVQLYANCPGCSGPWTAPSKTVSDPNVTLNTPPKYYKWDASLKRFAVSGDYTGNGKINPAMWNSANGTWYVPGLANVSYGRSGDVPIPGDYDGDGKTDYAVWRKEDATFYRRNISNINFGRTTDVPIPADYNNDGKTDIAVFRAANGTWYIRGIGSGGATVSYQFGTLQNDIPLPADYNGDGKIDLGLFRSSTHSWFAKTLGGTYIINNSSYGRSDDIPVPADYNGDGKTDVAIWRPSDNKWYLRNIATSSGFGLASSDIPAPDSYDNNKITKIGILRPSENKIYYRQNPSDSTTLNILLAL